MKNIIWQTVVDVKSDVLFMSLNSIGLKRQRLKKALDINYEYKTLYHFENTVAYSKEDLETFFMMVQNKLTYDKNYLFNFPNKVYLLANNLLRQSKKIQRINNLTPYSNRKLNNLFTSYIDKAAEAFPLIVISVPLEVIVTSELERFIQKKLKKMQKQDEFEKYFQKLTQLSNRETYFQKDYRNLLRIGIEIQNDNSLLLKFKKQKAPEILKYIKKNNQRLFKRFEDHAEKFSWINMYCFRRNPFSLADNIDRLKDILERDCLKELIKLDRKRELAKRDFKNAIADLEIGGVLRKKVEILPEYVFLRTYRLDVFTLSAYMIRNLLTEIGSRLGLKYNELIHLTLWEIQDLLIGKRDIFQIPVKKRMKNYAAIQIDGDFEIIVDKSRLQKLYKEKESRGLLNIKEIKGKVASKGMAKGVSRIVMHPTQITKIHKGDVLVAPMTSPDFVVGMLKAVAIVTDHGGITSHAAIVSRELGIPCIVGTKIATKVFKDGDFVEVDAVKGIVRKVSN